MPITNTYCQITTVKHITSIKMKLMSRYCSFQRSYATFMFSIYKIKRIYSTILHICNTLRLLIVEITQSRQIPCFNNISCHGFEFAMSYRALLCFVNDPESIYFVHWK
jgi:hypothetical protein